MGRKEPWEQVDADLYQVLGIARSASPDDVQDAWRARAKQTHPDRGGSSREFHDVTVAHEVLADPYQRRRYDRAMSPAGPPAASPYPAADSAPPGPATRAGWRYSWQHAAPASYRTQPVRQPQPGPGADESAPRKVNPWLIALAVLAGVAALVASYYLAIFTVVAGFAVATVVVASYLAASRRASSRPR